MGGTPEGVSYAIIFCNLLVPLIEKVTRTKSFGKERAVNAK
jgi:Na+-translocating ferredoxin:NAD+ oxidoreductase RnfD subunit